MRRAATSSFEGRGKREGLDRSVSSAARSSNAGMGGDGPRHPHLMNRSPRDSSWNSSRSMQARMRFGGLGVMGRDGGGMGPSRSVETARGR